MKKMYVFAVTLGLLAQGSAEAKGVSSQQSSVVIPNFTTGLVQPADWKERGNWDNSPVKTALPKEWNWNDYAKFQPIRNQGNCGSCWSFAIIGMIEGIHRLMYSMYHNIDLAEQTLVSSCESGGSCLGGYFSALNYVQEKGLPDESQDPYLARNSSCKSGLVSLPTSKITSWSYIGSSNSGPTTEQIKQAVYDHGPVVVDIVGHSLSSDGSVMKNCSPSNTDHMVVIEGWKDDAQYAANGGGYWIIRNSWGASWGDKGYLKLVYKGTNGRNCRGTGNVAAYAVLNGVQNLREHLGY